MLKLWRSGFFILIIFLTACTTNQTEPVSPLEKTNPFEKLSNREQEYQSEAPLEEESDLHSKSDVSDVELRALQKTVPEEAGPEMDTTQDNQQEEPPINDQPSVEERSDQTETPTEEKFQGEGVIEEQEETEAAINPVKELPFQDFKKRWNAVADQQLSNLYIENLQKNESEGGDVYSTKLSEQLELNIYVEEEYIQTLELIRKDSNNKADVATMLTGWMQIVMILHPEVVVHDVDSLFHDLGVGPNGDLSNVVRKEFSYGRLNYEVIPESNSFLFRATYRE
ncbi:hypothetical protein [Oceanobacillus salinisoli]|uniref:hypothetical protein n=1 Tax=Oceanobacillus salinisoli TaxID=2678611 RepID=UPI0012E2F4AF|nr:hypothetical protein [Oceanobacillus salinisoli]